MTRLQQARQGDVLLTRVTTLPAGAQPAPAGDIPGRLALAYGEATGHHHSIVLHGGRVVLIRDITASDRERLPDWRADAPERDGAMALVAMLVFLVFGLVLGFSLAALVLA
ncbi:MAG: hypothetical protein IT509_08450 [Rhodocyclaceae bacterium]|nr:hypothetical protein [Rhodocyclaceae bacterium]